MAGVPIPQSFNAWRSSSSSMFLPAVSIAASRVASVCRGFGLVLPSVMEEALTANVSPSFQSGSTVSGSGSSFSVFSAALHTARHPACLMIQPFAVNSTPPHSAVTVVTSLTHFSENASIMRPAIMW